MSDHQPITTLMTRAADGDKQAWDALVERYAPLVWSICRRHQPDADQAVWLQLAEHLGNIHDPAALGRLAGRHHPAGICAVQSAGRQRL